MTPTDLIKELMLENRELREEIERLKNQIKALEEAQKRAAPDSSEDGK